MDHIERFLVGELLYVQPTLLGAKCVSHFGVSQTMLKAEGLDS